MQGQNHTKIHIFSRLTGMACLRLPNSAHSGEEQTPRGILKAAWIGA
jgi:hypothetical protein